MVQGEFTILLENSASQGGKKSAKSGSSAKAETAEQKKQAAISPQSDLQVDDGVAVAPGDLSDDEILRGIRFVETLAGRASGGRQGGYEEKRDDTKVYGAYQIARGVWEDKIRSKYGWDFNDWFDPDGDQEKKQIVKQRQDRIAKELLLPEYKAGVSAMKLYETPLGRHIPKGILEITSQLGMGHLQRFLTSGEDRTAFDKMKSGQILGYLETAAKAVGKPLGNSFYSALNKMGGVKTKYMV